MHIVKQPTEKSWAHRPEAQKQNPNYLVRLQNLLSSRNATDIELEKAIDNLANSLTSKTIELQKGGSAEHRADITNRMKWRHQIEVTFITP